MLYNTGFKSCKVIKGPTQEQIYKMPEFFAMSRNEICNNAKCPDVLKEILDQYPWDGRDNVIQVRTQDFRVKRPPALGGHWHTDVMVLLNDGISRIAKSSDELHLMVCSWGGVVGTDFLTTPMEMGDVFTKADNFTVGNIMLNANAGPQDHYQSKDGELIEYTSLDIHRMGTTPNLGKFRLMIVAFDCSTISPGGIVLPSIEEREV
jgi:hypothetical protein